MLMIFPDFCERISGSTTLWQRITPNLSFPHEGLWLFETCCAISSVIFQRRIFLGMWYATQLIWLKLLWQCELKENPQMVRQSKITSSAFPTPKTKNKRTPAKTQVGFKLRFHLLHAHHLNAAGLAVTGVIHQDIYSTNILQSNRQAGIHRSILAEVLRTCYLKHPLTNNDASLSTKEKIPNDNTSQTFSQPLHKSSSPWHKIYSWACQTTKNTRWVLFLFSSPKKMHPPDMTQLHSLPHRVHIQFQRFEILSDRSFYSGLH